MTTYWIIKFHKTNPAKIIGFTYSRDVARELCSQPETRKKGVWFYGWSETPPHTPSKAGYPTAGEILKELYATRELLKEVAS